MDCIIRLFNLFLVNIILVEADEDNNLCEYGSGNWTHYNGKCYKQDSGLVNWEKAKHNCSSYKAEMPMMRNDSEKAAFVEVADVLWEYFLWLDGKLVNNFTTIRLTDTRIFTISCIINSTI